MGVCKFADTPLIQLTQQLAYVPHQIGLILTCQLANSRLLLISAVSVLIRILTTFVSSTCPMALRSAWLGLMPVLTFIGSLLRIGCLVRCRWADVGLLRYVSKCILDHPDRAVAAIDAKGHGAVFMSNYSFGQRILQSGISKIVNERVAEAEECLSCVGPLSLPSVGYHPQYL